MKKALNRGRALESCPEGLAFNRAKNGNCKCLYQC